MKHQASTEAPAGIPHLENVDMYVGHGEHGSAQQHAGQSSEGRLEARDVDQQPVVGVEAQAHHQDGPEHASRRLSSQLGWKPTIQHTRENKLARG